jgi:hypothetical protein
LQMARLRRLAGADGCRHRPLAEPLPFLGTRTIPDSPAVASRHRERARSAPICWSGTCKSCGARANLGVSMPPPTFRVAFQVIKILMFL